MSYADESARVGRIPVIFVELDMDACGRTYGSAPCTAAVGVTGSRKCYNTYGTCQDKANFLKVTKTYRFCEENAAIPVGVAAISLLRGVTYAPQQITPGKGLGVRASVTLRFKDAPWPDADIDPYVAERDYDTAHQGTFWGKFRARNPFYEGRVVRVRTGYVTHGAFSWANFRDRVYVLDAIKGPTRAGDMEVVAKDILKLADDKRALCPRPSKGQLVADISAAATSFTLKPAGIGNEEYPASGRLNLAGELVDFTRSGDSFTVTRGVAGTEAKSHEADDTVQLVKRFVNAEIQDVIHELLTGYATIPTGYIDTPAWDAERDAWLPGVWSADITEPTGVNTLVGELTEQGTCEVWWDEIAQQVKFRGARPPSVGLPVLTDADHFLMGSLAASEDPSQRVSQVLVYFDRLDPTAKLDQDNNYRQRYLYVDPQSEGPLEHGTPRVKKIFSRWFQKTSLGRVESLAQTLIKRYSHPPRLLEFKLDAAAALTVGDLFYAQTRLIQDVTGAAAQVNMLVTEAQEERAGSVVRVKAQENIYNEPEANLIIFSVDSLNVNLYDVYVAEFGTPVGPVEVTFRLLAAVRVGSSSDTAPALRTGAAWPGGSIVRIECAGRVAGAGGRAGTAGQGGNEAGANGWPADYHDPALDGRPGGSGQRGGTAFLAEVPCIVDNTSQIWGGGGGAGGGGGGGALLANDGSGYLAPWPGGPGGGGAGGAGYQAASGATGISNAPADPQLAGRRLTSGSGQSGTETEGGLGGQGAVPPANWDGGGKGGNGGSSGGPGLPGQAGQRGQGMNSGVNYSLYGLGAAGGPGGAAGNAVEGNSFITWVATGDRRGAIV